MNRKVRKALKFLFALVVVVCLAAVAFAIFRVRASWPRVEGTASAPGLAAPVTVVRDGWGIPHIWAETEHDLFLAQGYVHAQDRLWQMHFNRTVARGRLASLFGAAALPADRYLRTLGLARAAEKDWELLAPESRAALEAYAEGVNAFLTAGGTALPVELMILGVTPEPWTPLDTLAWSKVMSLNLSLNSILEQMRVAIARDVGGEAPARFLPPPGPGEPVILSPEAGGYGAAGQSSEEAGLRAAGPPGPQGIDPLLASLFPSLVDPSRIGGSNAWVVDGSHTESGKPLLANDTHLGLGLPSIWYENGLHAPGFDVVGFSLPGIPLVVIGQNSSVAWGITNLNADVQDLFYERLDDRDHPTRYELAGEWRDLEVIAESLAVKGGEAEALTVRLTHHGPLLHEVSPIKMVTEPYSMAWPALDGSRLLDALYRLGHAADWPSFRAALSLWDSPSLNFVYADVAGNIGYQATATTPIRPPGSNGAAPVPGWTGEHEWQGFIPFEEMPHGLNPPEGFFVTANNQVVSDDYPYLLTVDWPPADRARRITTLLAARLASGEALSARDMRNIQADTYSLGAERLRPYLVDGIEPEGETEAAALAAVSAWDLYFNPESQGAVVYQTWLTFLVEDLFDDDLSEELMPVWKGIALAPSPLLLDLMQHPADPLFDDRDTPEVEDRNALVAASFRRAVAWLGEELGGDPADWRWGDLHTISFAHVPLGQGELAPLNWIFNSETVAVGGSGSAVQANAGNPDRPFRVIFGASQRLVADLADLSRSLAANSTGQTSQPFHRHREDQVPLWRDVEYHPVVTRREALDEASSSTLILQPGEAPE